MLSSVPKISGYKATVAPGCDLRHLKAGFIEHVTQREIAQAIDVPVELRAHAGEAIFGGVVLS